MNESRCCCTVTAIWRSMKIPESLEAYYGLPKDVIFCKRCVMSNQRPSSYPEFRHKPDRKAPTLHIDAEGICDACRYAEKKNTQLGSKRTRAAETAGQTPPERRTLRLHSAGQRGQGQRICIPFVEIQVRHASPYRHLAAYTLH